MIGVDWDLEKCGFGCVFETGLKGYFFILTDSYQSDFYEVLGYFEHFVVNCTKLRECVGFLVCFGFWVVFVVFGCFVNVNWSYKGLFGWFLKVHKTG